MQHGIGSTLGAYSADAIGGYRDWSRRWDYYPRDWCSGDGVCFCGNHTVGLPRFNGNCLYCCGGCERKRTKIDRAACGRGCPIYGVVYGRSRGGRLNAHGHLPGECTTRWAEYRCLYDGTRSNCGSNPNRICYSNRCAPCVKHGSVSSFGLNRNSVATYNKWIRYVRSTRCLKYCSCSNADLYRATRCDGVGIV